MMLHSLRSAALAAGLALIATTVAAADPAATALLDRAAEAARGVTNAIYQATYVTKRGDRERQVRGQVFFTTLRGGDDAVGAKLAVEGDLTYSNRTERERFHLTYDGDKLRRLSSIDRKVVSITPAASAGLASLGTPGKMALNAFVDETPYADWRRDAADIAVLGSSEVTGAACTEIAFTYPESSRRSRLVLSLGVDDLLPRRIVESSRSQRGDAVTNTLTVTDLRVNTALPPGAFKLAPPEGFAAQSNDPLPRFDLRRGAEIPNFTLKDLAGNEHSLHDYKGKVVVLEFWATWCPFCLQSLPAMNETYHEKKDEGLEILAINARDSNQSDPAGVFRQQGVDLTCLLNGSNVAMSFAVQGIPAVFVIDREGRLVHSQSGFSEALHAELERVIDETLAR